MHVCLQHGSGLAVPLVAVDKADTADSCLVTWKYRTRPAVKQLPLHVVSVVGLKFRPNVNSTMR